MAANLANVNYTASVSKSPLAISFNQKFSGFILSAENNNLYAQSSNTSICANNKCPVDLSAFLSGNDMGAVYEIKRGSLSSIGGVAALTGTEAAITSVIPSADRLESSLAGNYTALFSTNTTLLTPTATNLSAVFDTETGKLLSAFHNKTASDGSLEAVDLYEPTPAVNVAAASTTDVGHLGKVLAWGMWSKGALALGQSDTNGQEITNDLTGNNNVHYMIGLPTNAAKLPSSGIITYQVKGGTIPQASFSTTINNKRTDVADVGTLNSNSQMVINFGGNTPNASLNMTLSGFTKASSLTSLTLSGTTNLTGNTLNFNTMSLSANAGNSVSCSKCSATGSFVGEVIPVTNASTVITSVAPQAIGLGYNISGTTTGKTVNTGFIVNGTAAFGNPTDTTRQGG
jgi:hypothetical protein